MKCRSRVRASSRVTQLAEWASIGGLVAGSSPAPGIFSFNENSANVFKDCVFALSLPIWLHPPRRAFKMTHEKKFHSKETNNETSSELHPRRLLYSKFVSCVHNYIIHRLVCMESSECVKRLWSRFRARLIWTLRRPKNTQFTILGIPTKSRSLRRFNAADRN